MILGDLVQVQALAEEGRLEEALDLVRRCPDLVGRAPSLVFRLLLALGRREAALRLLGERVEACHEPSDVLALCRLAELAAEGDAPDVALRILTRAARLDAASAVPRRLRHRLLLRLGRHRAAREALAGGPLPAWALHERAADLARRGRHEEAMAAYLEADDAFSRHQRAEHLWRQGRDGEAAREEEAALERDPHYLWSHWRLALASPPERGVERIVALPPPVRQAMAGLLGTLLDRAGRTGEADRVRLEGLPEPARSLYAARLQALRDLEWDWHPPRGREGIGSVRVFLVPAGAFLGPADLAALAGEVSALHARECPGASWSFEVSDPVGPLDYEELEGHVRHGNRRALARALRRPVPREGEALVVLAGGVPPFGASRGYGGLRTAVVQVAEGDRWRDSIVAHELYHAVAGLRHTDGEKDEWDPFGLMGWPGVLAPTALAWLDFRQRCHMATPPGVADLVQEGRDAEARRGWRSAARAYRAVLEADPLHLWALGRLVRVLLRLEEEGEALRWLGQGRVLDRGCELAAFHGELLAHLGRREEARREFARSLGYGRAARTHLSVGGAWSRAAEYRSALGEYHRAAGLDPADPEPRFHQASVRHALGHLGRAEALYRACLRRQPRWGAVLRRLALLCAEQGRLAEAGSLLARARPLQDRSAEQPYFEGRVAWLGGDGGAARRRLGRSRALEPREQPPRYSLGWVEFSLGRPEEARSHFARCRELYPRSFLGRCAAAFLDWLAGRGTQAARRARALVRRDARHAPLWLLLALEARSRGAAGRERRCLARLRRLEPRHPAVQE